MNRHHFLECYNCCTHDITNLYQFHVHSLPVATPLCLLPGGPPASGCSSVSEAPWAPAAAQEDQPPAQSLWTMLHRSIPCNTRLSEIELISVGSIMAPSITLWVCGLWQFCYGNMFTLYYVQNSDKNI